MRTRVYSQLIARPPESVWAYLSDLRNDAAWRREIDSVAVVSGVPGQAPTTYLETLTWEGMNSEVELKVTESVPGSRLVVESVDVQYSSRSAWTFEPHPEGTIVTLTFSLEAHGALRITERFVWGLITNWLERDLHLLEGHLLAAT